MSVARAVIDAGLARAAPDAAIRPCVAELLRHEGAARREALGVWADPVFTVLRGDNRAAFTGRGGEIVVVEGLVTGVGETPARTWLNFGPIRTVDFAVTIGRQGLKNFATAGLQPRALEGKSLRVRGLLDVRFGPQIDLVEPSAVEILTQDPAPPQSRPVARR
jgi:hypothetical protein